MSLTSQLAHGELGRWCGQHFTHTDTVAARVSSAAQQYRPVRPAGPVEPDHWAAIGGAFGQRLAWLVEPAPPYYALYGLVAAGLCSRSAADTLAAGFPTHATLTAHQAARALELRPGPHGWLDLGAAPPTAIASTPEEPMLADFFARTRNYLAAHAPPGTLGAPGAEAGLARVCAVMAGWEDAYRAGTLPDQLTRLHRAGDSTVDGLRATATQPVVDELVALARQLHTTGARETFRDRAGNPPPGQPLGTAGPVIVHHWADADLLTGATLWDVKTVLRVDKPERIARWLWQLVGYAWLDTADVWGIRSVGLYLARHGVTISWGLQALTDMLLGHIGAAEHGARADFLALARRVIAAEGGTPPGPWQPRGIHLGGHVPDENVRREQHERRWLD